MRRGLCTGRGHVGGRKRIHIPCPLSPGEALFDCLFQVSSEIALSQMSKYGFDSSRQPRCEEMLKARSHDNCNYRTFAALIRPSVLVFSGWAQKQCTAWTKELQGSAAKGDRGLHRYSRTQ